jgi:O-acetyl-ADP-ribose deacetylase (regulator of RNase III)
MAGERGVQTISFPSISTGAYGYPVEEAARIAIGAVAASLENPDNSVRDATFVLFDDVTYEVYARVLREEGTIE